MTVDEPRLIELAQQGDAGAYAALYDLHYDAVYRYCYFRLGDADVAQDLAGEVFARMVEKLDSFRHRGRPLLTWLYTIARNLIVDRQRRGGRAVVVPLDETLGQDWAGNGHQELGERRWLIDCLSAALKYLTEEQRQVIVLKFVEDYSNVEVARLLNKTEGSVKALQHRALGALRRVLEKERCYDA